jgi:hypothetical protein
VGTDLSVPLVVRAEANGKPIAGQLVNFVVTQGGGSVFAGSAITSVKGLAQEYWTLGTVAGEPQALEVRAVDPTTGVKQTFGTFTATPTAGSPATWDMPGAELIGDRDVRVRSRLLDAYSNPIPGAAATASVLIYFGPGLGVGIFPASGVTDANGIVTFAIEAINPYSYTATVTADADPTVETTFNGGFGY